MELLYMEKKLPQNLSDFSTTILIYAICRRTKEAVYQNQTRLNSWIPTADVQKCTSGNTVDETWPPSLPVLSRWRNSACDSLDLLHWNANAIIAKAGGWEHPAVLHLHLSRLVLLAPIPYLQTLAAAASARFSSRTVDIKKIETARAHIVKWALQDHYKARLSIVHAGAMLWHIRRYSVGDFLEPFGIFAATLVVWSYSTMMLFLKHHGSGPQVSGDALTDLQDGPLPLDNGLIEMLSRTSTMETEEDLDPKFLHLDRPCDDEMVQTYVRLGDKMSGHMSRVGDICKEGAPKKILNEGIRMLEEKSEDKNTSSSSTKRADTLEKEVNCCVWGAERPYADLLGFLVQSILE